MHFCLVFGEPGIGKSTSVAAALAHGEILGEFREPMPHVLYRAEQRHEYACQLGRLSGHFPGTDGLSYSIVKKVIPFVDNAPLSSVIAEGDRLSNLPFLSSVPERWVVDAVHLFSDDVKFAEARRSSRALQTGKKQNDSWVRGRRTKAWRLAEALPHCVWIDARSADLIEQLRARPAFAQVI
jgi:hypothetical protein